MVFATAGMDADRNGSRIGCGDRPSWAQRRRGHRRLSLKGANGSSRPWKDRPLKETVDTLIVIPMIASAGSGKYDADPGSCIADDVLLQGVRGISDLIAAPGLINLDLPMCARSCPKPDPP